MGTNVDLTLMDVAAKLAVISESQTAMASRMDTFVTRAELPGLVAQSVQGTVADAVEKGMAHQEEQRQIKQAAEREKRQKELDERDRRRDATIKRAAVIVALIISVLSFVSDRAVQLIGLFT